MNGCCLITANSGDTVNSDNRSLTKFNLICILIGNLNYTSDKSDASRNNRNDEFVD